MEAGEPKDCDTDSTKLTEKIDTSPVKENVLKRVREISQEPPTPTVDIAAGGDEGATYENGQTDLLSRTSSRSRRRPAKKGRVLDDTVEEDPQDVEPTEHEAEEKQMVISVSGSPPHETKMKQISEGVGGIKMIKKDGSTVATTDHPDSGEDVFFDVTEEAGHSEPSVQEPFPSVENGSASAVDEQVSSSSGSSQPHPSSRRSSESDDMDQDKILKRKLGDRAVSESREAESAGKKASRMNFGQATPTTSMGSKRSREDADKDANPRDTKRPSPPPDKKEVSPTPQEEVRAPKASSPKPKLVSGFMAYVGTSSPFASAKGPNLFAKSSTSASGPDAATATVKRPREDGDDDDCHRETKRPSPPPEQQVAKEQPQEVSNSSSAGFLAFASTRSPFLKVKGPNLFSSSNKSSESSSSWSSGAASPFVHDGNHSAFEGFASHSTPFTGPVRSKSPGGALGRSKSPSSARKTPMGMSLKNSNAFSAYAGGVQGFLNGGKKMSRGTDDVVDEVKKRRDSDESNSKSEDTEGSDERDRESEKEKISFGDRLRAECDDQGSGGSDEDGKVVLTEKELHTGEEEEETIYQVRGKLFFLADQNQWREKGTGIIKLNLRKSDGGGARLLMRKDAVYTVILNATLFKGMKCSYAPQDQRYLRFSTFESGGATHYNLRLPNAKIAGGLLEEMNAHIPS